MEKAISKKEVCSYKSVYILKHTIFSKVEVLLAVSHVKECNI